MLVNFLVGFYFVAPCNNKRVAYHNNNNVKVVKMAKCKGELINFFFWTIKQNTKDKANLLSAVNAF